jgi:hypothetical protein
MKTIRVSMRRLIALAALTLSVSFAADVDGKWTTQVEGRNGPRTEILTLKASGNTLSGTVTGGRGAATEISNGTVDGNSVSFTVVREFRDNKITQEFKGSLVDGQLKLTMSGGRGGTPVEMTYKRSAD